MSTLINKQNIERKLKNLLLQSGILPLLFLPTNGLFCRDVTHIYEKNIHYGFYFHT